MKSHYNTLSQILSNHFVMHPARRNVIAHIIISIIKIGNVNLTHISRAMEGGAKCLSSMRRLQRFFQFQTLSINAIVGVLFEILDLPSKLTLTLDRTNWKFGSKDINFLTLAFVYKGISIPFLFTLLDHKGNSDTDKRIKLLKLALTFLNKDQIECLLADREFVGQEWFQWLLKEQIPFCIRIKSNTLVNHKNGGKVTIASLCKHLNPLDVLTLANKKIWGCRINLTVLKKKSEEDEFVILAKTPTLLLVPLSLYKTRWTIEMMFKSLKTHGFNLENTRLKCDKKLFKLMALCSIAFAWSVRVGEIKCEIVPIKVKNHKRNLFTLFTYGLQTLQAILLKTKPTKTITRFIQASFSKEKVPRKVALKSVVY